MNKIKSNNQGWIKAFAILILILVAHTNAYAEVDASSAERRNKLMMQKLKQDMDAQISNMQTQFNAERAAYQQTIKSQDETISNLDGKLKKSESSVKYLRRELKTTQEEMKAVEASLAKTQEELLNTQTMLADLQTEHKKALGDLAFNENQRKTLTSNLSATKQTLFACEEKNQKLYIYGKELVQIYDTPSRYEAAMRKEQFLQLKRVELENILQNKLNQIDEQHIINNSKVQ